MSRPEFVVLQAADGGMAVTADQAAALGARNGHVQRTKADVLKFLVEHPELGLCDFCADPGLVWDFPSRDHDLISGDRSVGSWRACKQCTKLIKASRREDLARRASRHQGFPMRHMRAIHDEFWANREGPGEKL